MNLQRFHIKEVVRDGPIATVSAQDFVVEPFDAIPVQQVLEDPKFSLYCFDLENDRALFVESRDPAAVDRAPFYYQGQVEQAERVVFMPMEAFHRVARSIPFRMERLIFVHSVGRCGSTLVSKALQAVPHVHSLSEPDDLTQLVNLRTTAGATDGWIRDAIGSSIRWRCKGSAEFVAIKPRGQVLVLGDLFGQEFPQARHLFLYRNGLAWIRTIFRGFPADRDVYDVEGNRRMESSWARTLPLVRDLRDPEAPMNPVEIRILAWVTCLEEYLGLLDSGVPCCVARFEELTAQPLPVLREIFSFCGLDGVDWSAIEDVLARDALAGTIYDREERAKTSWELTDELVADVNRVVGRFERLRSPDVILPGTVLPSGAI